jgi:hypothetical protein
MAQGKDKGTHADKGKGKGWGVPPGSGAAHKGCDKGHQGKQTRASLLKARAGVYFLATQTRASTWRARAGVYIMPIGPLTQASKASVQTRANSWKVRARAASRIQAQSKGVCTIEAKIRPKLSKPQRGKRQAHQRAVSQDKEEEEEEKSASMKRRTKQQAQRRKAYALDQVPKVVHKGHNVPFAHRLCRKSPKELRNSVTGMVNKEDQALQHEGLG